MVGISTINAQNTVDRKTVSVTSMAHLEKIIEMYCLKNLLKSYLYAITRL
jgi:hypothetical protein